MNTRNQVRKIGEYVQINDGTWFVLNRQLGWVMLQGNAPGRELVSLLANQIRNRKQNETYVVRVRV